MENIIRYETADRVATITLNRPEKRNALSGELITALSLILEEAAADDQVRVVVLTGAGEVFSAGLDLEELRRMRENSALENEEDARRLAELYTQIYLHPKPVIARINGHAVAGGCGLATACDIAIAADHAKLGFTEVRIGFVPAIVSVFALRRVKETAARNLLLRGRLITAPEAVADGLITATVPAEELDEEVATVANEIATETSASAVSLTKRMLGQLEGMGFQEALAYAIQVNAFARGTEDCRAGIDAFLNKTSPPWRLG